VAGAGRVGRCNARHFEMQCVTEIGRRLVERRHEARVLRGNYAGAVDAMGRKCLEVGPDAAPPSLSEPVIARATVG
jgi:hypothetical protein